MKHYFVKNEDTGLIETWSLPYCIGNGHYAVSINEIMKSGLESHGFSNLKKAEEFVNKVKMHYLSKNGKVPNLSIVKAEFKIKFTKVENK